MTGHTVLDYLGLRRVLGSRSTRADQVWTVAMVVAVVTALFLTRDLDVWPQVGIVVAVAVTIGIVRSFAFLAATGRRKAQTRP